MSVDAPRNRGEGPRVRYSPRAEDVGAVIERYGIPEFVYHTWRNPELEKRLHGQSQAPAAPGVPKRASAAPTTATPIAPVRSAPPPSLNPVQVLARGTVPATPNAPAGQGPLTMASLKPPEPKLQPLVLHAPTRFMQTSPSARPENASMGQQEMAMPKPLPPAARPRSTPRGPQLVEWDMPADLAQGPLPILTHLVDASSWVKELAFRPPNGALSVARLASPAESAGLRSLTTLPELTATVTPAIGNTPPGQDVIASVSLLAQRAARAPVTNGASGSIPSQVFAPESPRATEPPKRETPVRESAPVSTSKSSGSHAASLFVKAQQLLATMPNQNAAIPTSMVEPVSRSPKVDTTEATYVSSVTFFASNPISSMDETTTVYPPLPDIEGHPHMDNSPQAEDPARRFLPENEALPAHPEMHRVVLEPGHPGSESRGQAARFQEAGAHSVPHSAPELQTPAVAARSAATDAGGTRPAQQLSARDRLRQLALKGR